MPQQRFFTPDSQPPNGGIPPGITFISVPQHAPPIPVASAPPPVYHAIAPPPVYHAPAPPLPVQWSQPSYDVNCCHHYCRVPSPVSPPTVILPSLPPPPSPPVQAPLPDRPPTPPGARLNGHTINFDQGLGFGYIFPKEHTMVHYFYDGVQPWLPHGPLNYWKRLVPSNMPVRELIQQMGAPEGADDRNGVTECIELGGGRWAQGRTFPIAAEMSRRTVEDAGFAKGHGGAVWLAAWTLP